LSDKNTSPSAPSGGFLPRPATARIQSVLYGNGYDSVERALWSLGRSAELAIEGGHLSRVEVAYGDSSPTPCLSDEQLGQLRALYPDVLTIEYDFFGGNLGSARGHNRLAANAKTDFLVIQNPDVVAAPRLLETLLATFQSDSTGMAEAKQLPIEHPKDYDPSTGETSWAATACAMIPRSLFERIGGFDADTFFLYCDDVDFSWQVRLAGYKVIFQPAAVIFHDKRLSNSGAWQPSDAEQYYSAEAALMLAHKWSRPDIVGAILKDFAAHGNAFTAKAMATFEQRRDEGKLPAPVDPDHRVGQFINGFYAKHRFAIMTQGSDL